MSQKPRALSCKPRPPSSFSTPAYCSTWSELPLRNAAANVQAAKDLLFGAKRVPPTIYLVVASPTPTEWDAHIEEAVQDCEKAVNSVSAVSDCCNVVGLTPIEARPADLPALPDRLRELSKHLLDASILLRNHCDALGRAVDRINNARKPARKGGQGAKDSVILEHAVQLVDALLESGFTAHRAFVSSNTADFSWGKTTDIHPEIKQAFNAPREIHYFISISSAIAWLGSNGWAP